MNKPIPQWAEDEKPREKLFKKGKEALSTAELLGILLSTGTKTKSAVDLGREIMDLAQHDLNVLARLTAPEYLKITGIGYAKAITIIAAFELGSRRKQTDAIKQKINTSQNAFDLLHPLMADKYYEEFWIISLNRSLNPISVKRISDGGITGTVVDVRRIFKLALEENAISIIVAHNHPSGNLIASEPDKIITRNLKNAGTTMDIHLKDHLIISANGYFSFADEGWL